MMALQVSAPAGAKLSVGKPCGKRNGDDLRDRRVSILRGSPGYRMVVESRTERSG
jgi:hypothetical protein